MSHPFAVAVGNFNGDVNLDLAVATAGNNTITVRLGNGLGGFTSAVGSPNPVGSNPYSIAVADLNGDGKSDLAVGNFSANNITVLLGNGSGEFSSAPGSPFAVGPNPSSIAVGDYNRDAKMDLAVANAQSNNVTVVLGDGSGGFSPTTGSPFATGGLWPISMVAGDFNGDAKLDLATANADSDNVSVLIGDGFGGFSPVASSPFAVGSHPLWVTLGDFNGDDTLDLTVPNESSDSVTLLTGDGFGGFNPTTTSPIATGDRPRSVAADDFNGDGRPDLAVANYGDNNLSIYLNHGGVTITESGATTVSEAGQTDTYTIALNGQPAFDVSVNINAGGQLSADQTSVTFTPADWNVPRTVTVSAIDDSVAEGDHGGTITHSVVSADLDYHGVNVASITVNIADNDQAGVIVNEGGGTTVTEEGATDSYTIRLTSQPTADVVISVNADAQVTTAPTTLTFTPGDWNIEQTVTVTAVDDDVPEGPHTGVVAHSASSLDPMYQNLSVANVVANITDNDPAVLVVESSGSTNVTEGGTTDTYTLALSTQPAADVVITVSGDSQVSASPSPVTFTTSNWNVPQTITVSAANDLVAEGTHSGTISHVASSDDPTYDGISIASVGAAITDNDTPGIVVTPASGLTTTEYGNTALFTVVLTSVPTSDVTIAVASSDPSEGTAAPSPLVFTPANALTPQTVTVTGVDDPTDDGDIVYTIVTSPATSSDPIYSGQNADDVSVTNTDDDAVAPNNTAFVIDGDGDKVKWQLRGPGTLTFSQDDPDHDGRGPVNALFVSGTNPKTSRLSLTVVKAFGTGDGFTTIGAITGSDLRFISASKANLIGSGVNIAGYLGGLTIRDILNGADVLALGVPEFRTTISAHDIGDGTAITLGTRLQSLTAARFGKGTINAPSLGTLNIKGDAKATIPADFRGDVTLSGAGIVPGKTVLSSVNVRGTVTGANFHVAGTVNSFRAGEFLNSVLFVGFDPTNQANPLAGGAFTAGLRLNSFRVGGLKNILTPAFDNSYVAASTIGSVSLKSVDPANGTAYGIVGKSINRATIRDSGFRFDPKLPSPQGEGSFEIWIV